MDHGNQGNAMTEVALALAMGFFSIMVLTMVSLGPGKSQSRETVQARLAPAQDETASASKTKPGAKDTIIVYHDGQYFDGNLNPVKPAAVARDAGGRVILALPPGLSMKEALEARGRIQTPDLIVSTLDAQWMNRLKEKTHATD